MTPGSPYLWGRVSISKRGGQASDEESQKGEGAAGGPRGTDPGHARSLPDDQSTPPDVIEPIVGWRYWFLHKGTLRSLSTYLYTPWPPRRALRAECGSFLRHPEGVPSTLCRCGIYAARDLETLKEVAQTGLQGLLVIGQVAIWGRTILGQRGYRGEYGYPRKLWLVRETVPPSQSAEEICAELAHAYGVTVESCEASWAISTGRERWAPVHPQLASSVWRASLMTSLARILILAVLAALFAPLAANPLVYLTVLGVTSLFVLGMIVLAYGVAFGRVSTRQFAAVQLALPLLAGAAILLLARR